LLTCIHIHIYMFLVLEIRCPEPVLAEHGILSVTGNDRMYGRTLIRTGTAENSNTGATSYKIGALAKYRCERGYKVVGEPLSTCEENGKWSGEVPQCVCKYPGYFSHFTDKERYGSYSIIIFMGEEKIIDKHLAKMILRDIIKYISYDRGITVLIL
jgi:hypothetical protein